MIELEPPFTFWEEHIRVDLPGAGALFTTRRGGVSCGPYATLNLGRLTADRREAVEENRARVETLVGAPLAAIRQVHGTTLRRVEAIPGPDDGVVEADGQITACRGVAPAVLVADCLPIVIAAGSAVAVLHAGWRGLAGGIVPAGVQALRELAGESPLEAAIGPGAGPCCYEVGEEVHEHFASRFRRAGNLDLKAIAHAQLITAGVGAVHDVGLCTICADPALFFSHRRDSGITGRQAGVAWLS